MEKRNIEVSIDLAKEWYKKGGDWKKLALTVFPDKDLNPDECIGYDEILKKFEENYPIYSLTYSSDGTDVLPNIIMSKPRLEKTSGVYSKNAYNVIFDTYRISLYTNEILKSTIRCQRMYGNDFLEGKICHYSGRMFDRDNYKSKFLKEIEDYRIKYTENIEHYQKEIDRMKESIERDKYVAENFDETFDKLIAKAKEQ